MSSINIYIYSRNIDITVIKATSPALDLRIKMEAQVLPASIVLITAEVHLRMDMKITDQLSGGNYWWSSFLAGASNSHHVDITSWAE